MRLNVHGWPSVTTVAPGDADGDTRPGDTHKNGGGSIWINGTCGPAANLACWGTGNPAPWPTEERKGDNLYTTSTIALDVDTGKIKGHHQYTPNDAWDWDEVSAPLLIDWPPEAWNLKTGKLAGVHKFPTFNWGPLLTTGGQPGVCRRHQRPTANSELWMPATARCYGKRPHPQA